MEVLRAMGARQRVSPGALDYEPSDIESPDDNGDGKPDTKNDKPAPAPAPKKDLP
jgi:hypothetical protein